MHETTIRAMFFAVDAAVTSHTEQELQHGQVLLGLQRLRTDHQPEKDQRAEPGCGHYTNHHH